MNTSLSSIKLLNNLNYFSNRYNNNIKNLSNGIYTNPNQIANINRLSRLKVDISSNKVIQNNIQECVSLLQVKDDSINSILNKTNRFKELSVKYSSELISKEEKEIIKDEAKMILKDIENTNDGLKFNNQKVFSNEDISIQVGLNKDDTLKINGSDMFIDDNHDGTFTFKDVKTIVHPSGHEHYEDIEKTFSVEDLLKDPDFILDKNIVNPLNKLRSEISYQTNFLEQKSKSNDFIYEINNKVLSSLEDVDIAKELMEKSKNELLLNINDKLIKETMDLNKNHILSLLN